MIEEEGRGEKEKPKADTEKVAERKLAWKIPDYPSFFVKHYKKLLFIPLLLLVISIAILVFKYQATGEVIKRDISLTGGTIISVYTDKELNLPELESKLSSKFGETVVRKLSEIGTGRQVGITIETQSEEFAAIKEELSKELSIEIDEDNSTIEITGAALGRAFSSQLIKAIVIAFLFMSLAIIILFRVFVPAFAVIFAAFADILATFATLSLFDIRISTAGIAAFLMLIGYSVDTDILLTTRVLKRREKEFKESFKDAMHTGLTMTFASMAAFFVAYFFVISPILKEIFLILTIGLVFDIINTWIFNSAILKIYLDKKQK